MLAERLRCVKRRYANAVFRIWVDGGGVACSPADAGAQLNHDHRPRLWAPAFAGERDADYGVRACPKKATTPAKAGAQLGVGGNGRRCFVTPDSPTGPRPSPGWGEGRDRGQWPLSIVLYPPFALSAVEGLAPSGVLRLRSARTGLGKAAIARLNSSPCPPEHSSRSTASCRAARCRSSRSDAPAPACAPPSARAGPHGCRG